MVVAAAFGEVIAKYEADYKIFTDGSLKDGIVGSGVVRDAIRSDYRLPNQRSVFSAETFAIWKGLEATLSVLAAIKKRNRKTPLDSTD